MEQILGDHKYKLIRRCKQLWNNAC